MVAAFPTTNWWGEGCSLVFCVCPLLAVPLDYLLFWPHWQGSCPGLAGGTVSNDGASGGRYSVAVDMAMLVVVAAQRPRSDSKWGWIWCDLALSCKGVEARFDASFAPPKLKRWDPSK